jgi:hypothetical protein
LERGIDAIEHIVVFMQEVRRRFALACLHFFCVPVPSDRSVVRSAPTSVLSF